jgi:hypothetical protein
MNKLKVLEIGLLVFVIWCFVFAILGLFFIGKVLSENKGCDAKEGKLLGINLLNDTETDFAKVKGVYQSIEYNAEVIVLENNSINVYPIMQNLTKEYIDEMYEINKTYLINKCDGVIRGLVNDNWFNRWIT